MRRRTPGRIETSGGGRPLTSPLSRQQSGRPKNSVRLRQRWAVSGGRARGRETRDGEGDGVSGEWRHAADAAEALWRPDPARLFRRRGSSRQSSAPDDEDEQENASLTTCAQKCMSNAYIRSCAHISSFFLHPTFILLPATLAFLVFCLAFIHTNRNEYAVLASILPARHAAI